MILLVTGLTQTQKYKVDCFLTGVVNDSKTLYLDENQKQGTFVFEKIPIGKNVNVKVRVYEYNQDLEDFWLVCGELDSTRIQQKEQTGDVKQIMLILMSPLELLIFQETIIYCL